MALPNPALTFQMPAALVATASTAKDDVVAAIAAAINALTGTDSNWTAAAATGDAADTPGILIAAPATSPISGFRAIIGASNAAGNLPLTAQYRTPDTQIASTILLSIGPDGHSGANNWYAADPYGVGNRSSGFWKCSANAQITRVGVIASAETLTILLRGGADNQWRIMHFGAILDPPDTASAEADERIYGMMVMGSSTSAWITNARIIQSPDTISPFNYSSTNGNTHFGVFDPVAPSSWLAAVGAFFYAPYASGPERASTRGGGKFLTPCYANYWDGTDLNTYLGRIRGLFLYEDSLMREVIQDGVPADRGFCISTSTVATNDALILANE